MAGGPSPYRRKDRAKAADYAALVFDLRIQGLTYAAIDALTQTPDGPTGGHRISITTAKELVYAEAARRIDPKVDAWRVIQVERLEESLLRLDELAAAAHAVLERKHITVNNGHIINLDGAPLPDDGPVLAAIDRLVKIEDAKGRTSERLSKILGTHAPTRIEQQVTEVTQQDIELQEMVNELKTKNATVTDQLRSARKHPE